MKKGLIGLVLFLPLFLVGQTIEFQGQEAGNAAMEQLERQVKVVEEEDLAQSRTRRKELRKALRTFVKDRLKGQLGKAQSAPVKTQNMLTNFAWGMIALGLVCLIIVIIAWIALPPLGAVLAALLWSFILGGIVGGLLLLWLDHAWNNRKRFRKNRWF